MAAKDRVYYATGKRKTSAARVFLSNGTGKVTINNRNVEEYLATAAHKAIMEQPLTATENKGKFDLYITVKGGGMSGQAGAIRHGITRALLLLDPENRPVLKKAGLITRDSRMVERKKYGKHKARKSTQFSKR